MCGKKARYIKTVPWIIDQVGAIIITIIMEASNQENKNCWKLKP
jgi:hypothetical protein